jgi:hypothetical protein
MPIPQRYVAKSVTFRQGDSRMRRRAGWLLRAFLQSLVFAAAGVAPGAVAGDAATYPLTYSGRLVDPTGAPLRGPLALHFYFFNAPQDGTSLGTRAPYGPSEPVELVDGVFQVQLDLTAADLSAIFGDASTEVWLEIRQGTSKYPRQRFTNVPLALSAHSVPVDGQTIGFDAAGKLTLLPGGVGSGNMRQADYDHDGSGVVDDAEQLGGRPASFYTSVANLTGVLPFERLPVGTVAGTIAAGDDGRLSNARPPTGAAGGDLNGTYPNPTLKSSATNDADRAIRSDHIKNQAITTPKLADAAVTNDKLASGIAAAKIATDTTRQFVSQDDQAAWDTAVGWGNHASVGYLTSVPWGSPGALGETTPAAGTFTTVQANNLLKLMDNDSTANYVSLRAADTMSSDVSYTLPATPLAGRYLRTDPDGVLSWDTPAGAGDMNQAIYDSTGNGKVDMAEDAEKLAGQPASYYRNAANLTGQVAYASLPVGTASGTVAAGNDARFVNARPPTGVAGGDLSGSFPNPSLKSSADTDSDRAVGTDHIKTAAVTTAKLADGAVTDAKLAGAIAPAKVATNASNRFVSDANIASWSSAVSWGNHASVGYLTSVPWGSPGALGETMPAAGTFTTLQANNLLKLMDNDATANYVSLRAADTMSSDVSYTLPAAPDAGKYLMTDSSGVLSWGTPAGIGDMRKAVYDSSGEDGKVDAAENADKLAGQAASYYLDASNITAGTLPTAQVPDLDAGKLTSGTLAYARLPIGTGASTVAAGDDARFGDPRPPTGAAGGDLSGGYPNPSLKSSASNDADRAVGTDHLKSAAVTTAKLADGAVTDAKVESITTPGKVSGAAINAGTIGGSAAFAGSGGVTTTGGISARGHIQVQGTGSAATELRFLDGGNSNYVGLKAPPTLTASKIWTLPAADGSNGEFLVTDGQGGLSWSSSIPSPVTLAGDVSGQQSSTVVSALRGRPIAASAPTTGAFLRWSGAAWEPALGPYVFTLTDAANITIDGAVANAFAVTLGGDRTLDNPVNLVDGMLYTLRIKQDGVGGRSVTWGANFDFGSTSKQINTVPNSATFFQFASDGSKLYLVGTAMQVSCTAASNVYTTEGPSQVTVPNGCNRVTVKAWGAGGGNGSYSGGAGGYAAGTFQVNAGETLTVQVGGGGGSAGCSGNAGGGAQGGGACAGGGGGGYGGGGGGSYASGGGGGGGRSAVYGSSAASDSLVIAGGGGGGGPSVAGGAGGGSSGQNGTGSGGQGATGGSGGTYSGSYTGSNGGGWGDGSAGQGGDSSPTNVAGGTGGGLYGVRGGYGSNVCGTVNSSNGGGGGAGGGYGSGGGGNTGCGNGSGVGGSGPAGGAVSCNGGYCAGGGGSGGGGGGGSISAGGGGGGYAGGGGGGHNGSGGGGSSKVFANRSVTNSTTLAGSGTTPANSGDTDYASPAGQPTREGRVVLIWSRQ